MARSKRIRRGTEGWLKLVSRQSSSGLTVRGFCQRERINASLFRRWQLRLWMSADRVLLAANDVLNRNFTPLIDDGREVSASNQ